MNCRLFPEKSHRAVLAGYLKKSSLCFPACIDTHPSCLTLDGPFIFQTVSWGVVQLVEHQTLDLGV